MGILAVLVAIGAVAISFVGFLMIVGAVNGRAEDEYWAEFWDNTPTTEGASEPDADIIMLPETRHLKRAA